MNSSFIFRCLITFGQIFTASVSISLGCTIYFKKWESLWLDAVYTVGCWIVVIWLSKQDLKVLERRFTDYFFEEDE